MKTTNILRFAFILVLLCSSQTLLSQHKLRVIKTGLGDGVIKSAQEGIDCGHDCEHKYGQSEKVKLRARAMIGSTFVGWEGDKGTLVNDTTLIVNMNQVRSVRAKFKLKLEIPEIKDFSPEGIGQFLRKNPHVNTPSRFLKALPREYRQNWILMTRSESLQTGTAKYPRILLPSADARRVFTIGIGESKSHPGSHRNAIEYMQWDKKEKNFRMHEIILGKIPTMGLFPNGKEEFLLMISNAQNVIQPEM